MSSNNQPLEGDQTKESKEHRLVLVLDDDTALAETMSQLIKDELNWDVATFYEAESALDFLHIRKPHVPDMIVLDVIMPGISGLEFYDHLKADSSTASIPVLFVSGATYSSGLHLPKSITFLSKPFTVDAFLSAIKTLLGMEGANPVDS